MAENKQPQPRNIFEVINLNIIDISKDIAVIFKEIHEIHEILFPKNNEPNTLGAKTDE
jgi:hypothetical protein